MAEVGAEVPARIFITAHVCFTARAQQTALPPPPTPTAAPSPLSFSISSEIFHHFKGNKISSVGNANSLPGLRALKLYAVLLMGCWGRPLVQVPFRSHHAAGSASSPFE